MTRVRWTTDAADQVEGIIKRIQEGNPAAALRVAQTLLDTIAHLEAFLTLADPDRKWREPANWSARPM